MINKKIIAGIIGMLSLVTAIAQQKDTSKILKEVIVTGYKTVNGVGHLLEMKDGIIYAGKKTEVIIVDSLDANKAINNTRQILGRIPGLNIVETESSGFTANGIATRGLNPTQSIEMNTRQNGYNISADVYGYNEAYYIPPMEAVKRIEMVRGASSLQFGAQFGGLVNYITEDAPTDKPFQFITSQTVGSFGMYNAFTSVGGTYKKISYYGFLQQRNMDGYRPNSQQWQLSGFGKIQYTASKKINAGLEYSLLRNKIHMPGGLSDSLFNANPKASVRARNWLKSPWNIVSGYLNLNPNDNTTFSLKTTYIFSNRSLVWRNEDGGAGALDAIDPATNQYVPREVESEDMHSVATEARFAASYKLGKSKSTLAGGVRFSYGWFKRLGGGEGSTNSDFDLSITGDWEKKLNFTTTNIAPFVENIFRIGNKLTVTPGVRLEYLNSTVKGYTTDDIYKVTANKSKNRVFLLSGIGIEYKPKSNAGIYANISQAYRPIDYSQQQPFGVTSKIDPNLKDANGFNSDLGYRTTIKNYLNVDVSLFYLAYNNRIGEIVKTDPTTGLDFGYRTNIANSVHKGLEAYIEFNILKYLNQQSKQGISIFNSYSYIDAKYTSGEFNGNRVEAAAKHIERAGIIYSNKSFSSTFQVNYIGDAYGDATNVKVSDNPIAGYIPAYTVVDFSATYKINNYAIKAGVNNLGNKYYFTRRTDEYPGPGIIPAVGRSFYVGLTAKF
ncbi:TonB-dependent receptor [Ferruginibacter sp.]|uniref:TonB-dependent receptor family protein n=1 Tax=Ferruginibacter sp. TaxID=1940288 RepID=UPI0019B24FA4|nr:TonB-dependent receptor [Ferruginibacter sp.]MBC7626071.1 TonB-dependent receptor [Ferruginibacter sp.]